MMQRFSWFEGYMLHMMSKSVSTQSFIDAWMTQFIEMIISVQHLTKHPAEGYYSHQNLSLDISSSSGLLKPRHRVTNCRMMLLGIPSDSGAHTLFPKRNATLMCQCFTVPLGFRPWYKVMSILPNGLDSILQKTSFKNS